MTNKNDSFFRPLEIVHDFNFLPCNCDQNTKLLSPKERIKRLKNLGYGGIVISPSFKDYLSDESIKDATELIKYANEQGLLVWIYDELYYPSGSAGGIVPKEHPEYEAKGLAVLTADALVGETQNACLLVNASDEGLENVCVNGKILNNAKSFCIYNPHTDVTEDSASPVISIPKKESRIIFVKR